MSGIGFEIHVGAFEELCHALKQGHPAPVSDGTRPLLFPAPFGAAEILQLGTAVSSATGVDADFGNDDARREVQSHLFADRLDGAWVAAAAALNPEVASAVCAAWILEYVNSEGELPAWANEDRSGLVREFLRFCGIAAATHRDLVMVWEL